MIKGWSASYNRSRNRQSGQEDQDLTLRAQPEIVQWHILRFDSLRSSLAAAGTIISVGQVRRGELAGGALIDATVDVLAILAASRAVLKRPAAQLRASVPARCCPANYLFAGPLG
jgi:hypothetical protein